MLIAFADITSLKMEEQKYFIFSLLAAFVLGILWIYPAWKITGKIIAPLEEANRLQKEFVLFAGHELKTPVTVMKASLDMLEREVRLKKGKSLHGAKDKYNLFRQQVKDSFVADCAIAVLKALENCISKEKFIEKMKQFGWSVNWTEKRKHITFQNQDGKKVRDSNLSKTFHLDISKEGLENEFNCVIWVCQYGNHTD